MTTAGKYNPWIVASGGAQAFRERGCTIIRGGDYRLKTENAPIGSRRIPNKNTPSARDTLAIPGVGGRRSAEERRSDHP